jgi:hypothetical protein
MTVKAKIRLMLEAIDDGDKSEVGRGSMKVSLTHLDALFQQDIVLRDGTTNDKIDLIWSDTRSLTTGASEDIDLAGGVTDIFGNTLTFVEVSHLFFFNHDTTAGEYFRMGPAASNGWYGVTTPFLATGDSVIIRPSATVDGITYPGFAWFSAPTGYVVTAGSADSIGITNSGSTTNSYSMIVLGRSA